MVLSEKMDLRARVLAKNRGKVGCDVDISLNKWYRIIISSMGLNERYWDAMYSLNNGRRLYICISVAWIVKSWNNIISCALVFVPIDRMYAKMMANMNIAFVGREKKRHCSPQNIIIYSGEMKIKQFRWPQSRDSTLIYDGPKLLLSAATKRMRIDWKINNQK